MKEKATLLGGDSHPKTKKNSYNQITSPSEFKDKEGRFNMVIGKLGGTEVTLLNVYVPPPGSKWEFIFLI